jgi:hypothetical protein
VPEPERLFSYVGCFVDDGHRDLESGPMAYGYNSVTCNAECTGQGFPFFALQNNGWCVCGNAYGTAPAYRHVSDNECGGVCTGDDQLCGAGWRNAVYRTQVPEPERVYSYVGCYVDDSSRDLESGPMAYGYNSVTCNDECTSQGFPFFALQNNGWCVCGNAYGTESQYNSVPDNECGGVCAGDDQLCGAGWRNAVYRTSVPEPERLYSYVGCFTDNSRRDLESGPMAYGYTSVTCNQACSAYNYFALQNNGWCVCGDAYATQAAYRQVADDDCGSNCVGDDQRCGAGWRNAVFSRV